MIKKTRKVKDMDEEKREEQRVPYVARVILKAARSKVVAEADSKDISVKGMFLKTEKKIPPGTPCKIEILLTGTSARFSLNTRGVITRQDADGMGVEFKSMNLDSYSHLKNIVMYNESDSGNVEKEALSL